MDAVTLTILAKTILAALLICVAILTATLGFVLFKNGAGLGRDHLVLKWRSFEGRAHSVGSVMMLTTCLWALPVSKAIPSYEESADGSKHVYSAGDNILAVPLTIRSGTSVASLTSDPRELASLLRNAIKKHDSDADLVTRLNGQVARYDPTSIHVYPTGDGNYRATAHLSTADSGRDVYFTVEGKRGMITFRPWPKSRTVPPSSDPNSIRLPSDSKESTSPGIQPFPVPRHDEESGDVRSMPSPTPGDNEESNTPEVSPLPFGR